MRSVKFWRSTKDVLKGAIGNLPVFLSANNLKSFISDELARSATEIKFRLAEGSGGLGGNIALGYRATLLQEVCNVYLKAKHAQKLLPSQEHIAACCLVMLNGLATVGIVALVDEATGYQDERERNALAKLLEAYVAKELRPWVHTFPVEFYRQMYRLRGLPYPDRGNKMPQYFGKLTMDVVYNRLPYGVAEELKRLTPRDSKGRLVTRLHQRLTEELGHPKLREHLGAVTALMKISNDNDWQGFMVLLDRHYSKPIDWGLFRKSKEQQKELEAKTISSD